MNTCESLSKKKQKNIWILSLVIIYICRLWCKIWACANFFLSLNEWTTGSQVDETGRESRLGWENVNRGREKWEKKGQRSWVPVAGLAELIWNQVFLPADNRAEARPGVTSTSPASPVTCQRVHDSTSRFLPPHGCGGGRYPTQPRRGRWTNTDKY